MAGITWKNFLDAMNPKKSFIAKTIDDKRRKAIEEENVSDGTDWYNEPGALTDNSKIDEQVEKELANTKDEFTGQKKEPLEGQRGSAKGNQGDNVIANPNAPDTAEVEKRHIEEQAALQNALGTSEPVSGTIIQPPSLGEEAEVKEGEIPEGEVPPTKTDGDNNSNDNNSSGENELEKAPEDANLDFSDYIKNYYGPKNGADYVKALWNNGEYGKAVGNVLGNLLGNLGTINVGGASTGGRDFHSDWEDYRNNYTKAQAERNQQAFDQNMNIANQLRTNDVARNEMLKTLENYQKIGKKLTPAEFENIRKAMTATGNGSQVDYYLASVLGEISNDPDLKKAAKEAGGNAVKLIGNLAQFSGNAIRPLNWFFGQASDTMNNMFGGK